jgi:N-acetylmuramoyl-L-alanine amidase CwlA
MLFLARQIAYSRASSHNIAYKTNFRTSSQQWWQTRTFVSKASSDKSQGIAFDVTDENWNQFVVEESKKVPVILDCWAKYALKKKEKETERERQRPELSPF